MAAAKSAMAAAKSKALKHFGKLKKVERKRYLRLHRVYFKDVEGKLTHKSMQFLRFTVELRDIDFEDFSLEHGDMEPIEVVRFISNHLFESALHSVLSSI